MSSKQKCQDKVVESSSTIQQSLNATWLKETWTIDPITYENEECVVLSCQKVLKIGLPTKYS